MLNAELYLKLNPPFTQEQKEVCKPVIHRMVELGYIASREGMLALDGEMQGESNGFLKKGVDLLVNGIDPEQVEQILLRMIFAGGTDMGMLPKLLMADGLLTIQAGENPRTLLCAALGADEDEFLEDTSSRYEQLLLWLQSKEGLPESTEFETLLMCLDSKAIQRMLKDVESQTLTGALSGCGYTAIHKIIENVSQRLALMLAEDMQHENPTIESILGCQDEICKLITSLGDKGLIQINKLHLVK